MPPPSLPVCTKSVSQTGLMCRQFLVPPSQILVNQNWKSWPDSYLGRLWIFRDAFSGTTSENGRQRVRFDQSEHLTGDFETGSKSIFPTTLRPLVCHAGADAILAHQRAPSPAHLPLAGGFQPKPDNSPERTVSPVLVLGWIPLG